jgi:hypothetical protein
MSTTALGRTPVIAAYPSELTARLAAQLEDRVLGAWPIGSGALGDFDRLRSDVDVQAVCTPARANGFAATRDGALA